MPAASPVAPTKPITSPAFTCAPSRASGGERGQVRVVELVPLEVAEPEAVAADRVPADEEERPVGHGEDRRAERREDVVPVVPAGVGARGAEVVRERGRTVDREDVAAGCQVRPDPGGRALHRRRRRGDAGRGRHRLVRMVGRRRARGRARRRRGGLRRGRGRLGIADEDLRPGGQTAVVGGQMDVEADDEAAMAAALRGVLVRDRLLEHDRVTPVAQRDLLVRRSGHARPEDDEARDRRAGEIAARARRGGARHRLRRHRAWRSPRRRRARPS